VALIAAVSLFIVGLPTRHGESPRFLQFYAAPMVYPAIVLIFFALGIAEVITWAVTVSFFLQKVESKDGLGCTTIREWRWGATDGWSVKIDVGE
jgi:hypothetical protein